MVALECVGDDGTVTPELPLSCGGAVRIVSCYKHLGSRTTTGQAINGEVSARVDAARVATAALGKVAGALEGYGRPGLRALAAAVPRGVLASLGEGLLLEVRGRATSRCG